MVLVGMRPRLPVIANQSADWCGNPPAPWNRVTITTKNRGNSRLFLYCSVHSPSIGGIATTSVRTGLAMTACIRQTPIYRSVLLAKNRPAPVLERGGWRWGSVLATAVPLPGGGALTAAERPGESFRLPEPRTGRRPLAGARRGRRASLRRSGPRRRAWPLQW